MSMFGSMGRGISRAFSGARAKAGAAKAFMKPKMASAGKAARVAGAAGKNIGRGMGQAVSETAARARKAGKMVMNTKPKDLAGRLGRMAKNPKKMRALGKKLAKYGAAGAAGYYMGKD